MINIKEHKEYIQSVLYLHKENIINKSYKENELNLLIKKLNLFDLERKNYISIEQFIYNLQQIDINISTHKYISYDNNLEIVQEIIYNIN